MKITIHQPHVFPWLGYVHKFINSELFVVVDTVQFNHREWQNRNFFRIQDRRQMLTVPLVSSPLDIVPEDKMVNANAA